MARIVVVTFERQKIYGKRERDGRKGSEFRKKNNLYLMIWTYQLIHMKCGTFLIADVIDQNRHSLSSARLVNNKWNRQHWIPTAQCKLQYARPCNEMNFWFTFSFSLCSSCVIALSLSIYLTLSHSRFTSQINYLYERAHLAHMSKGFSVVPTAHYIVVSLFNVQSLHASIVFQMSQR